MKLENNWQFKTLENLEKDVWPPMGFDSHLITRISKLRKVPLNELEVEDLRIMIGQNVGLRFLVPLALERLKENILVEGDHYPGDLLVAVASIENEFWKEHLTYKKQMDTIISDNLAIISDNRLKLGENFNQ
jgi:hypothetical protein